MATSNKPEFTDLQDVLFKYLKYWKWILASGIVFAAFTYIVLSFIDPTYNITANTMIKEDSAGGPGGKLASSLSKGSGMGGLLGGPESSVEDDAFIMGSYSAVKDMAYDLGLYKTYTLKKFPFDQNLYNSSPIVLDVNESLVDSLSASFSFYVDVKLSSIQVKVERDDKKIIKETFESLPAKIKTPYGEFTLKESATDLNIEKPYSLEIVMDPLDYCAENLMEKVDIGQITKRSQILSLNIEEIRPARGIDILNYLIRYYNDDALAENNKQARTTIAFIEERVKDISTEVDSLEQVIAVFKKANKVVDVGIMANAFATQYWSGQEKSIELDVQCNLLDMLDGYVDDPKNEFSLIPMAAQLPETAARVVVEFNNVILERERLLQNSNENNPAIQTIDMRIKLLRNNIKESVKTMRNDCNVQRKNWGSYLSGIVNEMGEMPSKELEYVEVERLRQVKSALYIFLLTKKEETQLLLASDSSKAKVVNSAYCELVPVAPRKKVIAMVAFAIGLLLPVLVIYIRTLLRRKVSSKEELEGLTTIPVIGEVCLSKDDSKIVIKEGVDSSIAELIRLIRTNLQFILKKDKKVILVTSNIAGEGKSFFSLNLALSLSLIKDKKVVLVGLDIRSPKIAEYLSISNSKGVTSFLAMDDFKVEDIIIPQPKLHPNFSVIPAGPVPPNPSELLLSDRVDELFDYLKAKFDYIVVDTAPIGMVSDTFTLDRISDVTLAVFRADYTDKSNLKLLDHVIAEDKLKNLNIVLNGTTTKSSYGYGYGKK